MNIHYYEIKNCYLGESCGQPVIFPPKDTDRRTLTKYGFVQLTDSVKLGHFLSDEEYQYIMKFSAEEDVTFGDGKYDKSKDNRKKTADIIAGLSVILMIIAVVGSLVDFSLFFALCFIVSVVLAIALQLKFPENINGRVIIRVYHIFFLILVIFFLIFVIVGFFSIIFGMNSCMNSCCETAYVCGSIG